MAFHGTVRAFEARALANAVEGFLRYDVTAGHHHWRVCIGGLLFGDGADEDGVEVVGWWERDFDLMNR